MSVDLSRLIDRFADINVLVIGDPILDVYLEGAAARLCREAPLPVVEIAARKELPGGAANVAVNAAALGARVTLMGVIGDDPEGFSLRHALETHRVPTDYLFVQRGRSTPAKHRLIGGAQMLARFDQGKAAPLTPAIETQLLAQARTHLPHCDAVLLSDYGYGLFSPSFIRAFSESTRTIPRLVLADSPNLSAFAAVRPTVIKPSYQEALRLLGIRPRQRSTRSDLIASHAAALLKKTGAHVATVTLDIDGVIVLEPDRPVYRTYARPQHRSSSTGGGDTYISAMALALASGAETPAAAELAAAAAAVVVGKEGTAVCTARELRDCIYGGAKRVADREALKERLEYYRGQGKRIVFTNGCFDILHRGHVGFLNRAKGLGDVLIVGINSDASVRRIKGVGRPINTLDDRIKVLAAMSYIDHIVAFDNDTPVDLITAIRPDIFAKGGDYTREMLPEAPLVERLGGAVCVLPFLEERSTSSIIARIQQAARTG